MTLSRRIRKTGVAILSVLLLLALLILAYTAYINRNGNFHVVADGQFYRSGELKPAQLEKFVQQYGLRSILNLEGDKAGRQWYDDELAASARLGIAHFDYHLSAKKMLTPEQVDAVLEIVRAAPKPLLVHCRDGADRTGLVSALYLAEIQGQDKTTADKQLSLNYGHFPYLGSGTRAMDQTFWLIEEPAR